MKNLWVAVMELAIVELRGIHSTFGRAAQKPDWLVERTGFEPPRPVDFAAGHHGLNRSTDEDPLCVRADQQPVTWACLSMMKWGIDQALIRRLLLAYEEFLSRRP